eukprot:TRINITY_DN37561_c0_g2_i1.p1 TRINITY_DN37561_c0_g2~~TRINITY_DN37561_c0_g2_i1.p1  ORF type:complete len:1173 (+),score=248.00 TRINITY_DN37561_c0_g2_i1:83-3520(+)
MVRWRGGAALPAVLAIALFALAGAELSDEFDEFEDEAPTHVVSLLQRQTNIPWRGAVDGGGTQGRPPASSLAQEAPNGANQSADSVAAVPVGATVDDAGSETRRMVFALVLLALSFALAAVIWQAPACLKQAAAKADCATDASHLPLQVEHVARSCEGSTAAKEEDEDMSSGQTFGGRELPALNFPAMLRQQALLFPSKPFVELWSGGDEQEHGPIVWTFSEFAKLVAGQTMQLREAGLTPGSRCAVLCYGGIDAWAAILAVMAVGGSAVLVSAMRTREEIATMMETARCTAILVAADLIDVVEGEEVRQKMAEKLNLKIALLPSSRADGGNSPSSDVLAAPTPPGYEAVQAGRSGALECLEECPAARLDEAAVLFTSGSSGPPKGVRHSHAGLMWDCLLVQREMPAARRLCLLPHFHVIGLTNNFLASLVSGGCVILPSDVRKPLTAQRLRDAIEACKPTCVDTVPHLLQQLLALWEEAVGAGASAPAGLRVQCGGAPLDARTFGRLQELRVEVVNHYGQTELGSLALVGRTPLGLRPVAGVRTVGMPPLGQGEGELVLEGHFGMGLGYLDPAGKATSDAMPRNGRSWRTNDIFKVVAMEKGDALLEYCGRVDDTLVLSSGELFNPVPVEGDIRAKMPPGTRLVLIGTALPTPVLGVEAVDESQVRQALLQLRPSLPRHGCIRHYLLLPPGQLPLTAKGTVERRKAEKLLRESALEEMQRHADMLAGEAGADQDEVAMDSLAMAAGAWKAPPSLQAKTNIIGHLYFAATMGVVVTHLGGTHRTFMASPAIQVLTAVTSWWALPCFLLVAGVNDYQDLLRDTAGARLRLLKGSGLLLCVFFMWYVLAYFLQFLYIRTPIYMNMDSAWSGHRGASAHNLTRPAWFLMNLAVYRLMLAGFSAVAQGRHKYVWWLPGLLSLATHFGCWGDGDYCPGGLERFVSNSHPLGSPLLTNRFTILAPVYFFVAFAASRALPLASKCLDGKLHARCLTGLVIFVGLSWKLAALTTFMTAWWVPYGCEGDKITKCCVRSGPTSGLPGCSGKKDEIPVAWNLDSFLQDVFGMFLGILFLCGLALLVPKTASSFAKIGHRCLWIYVGFSLLMPVFGTIFGAVHQSLRPLAGDLIATSVVVAGLTMSFLPLSLNTDAA